MAYLTPEDRARALRARSGTGAMLFTEAELAALLREHEAALREQLRLAAEVIAAHEEAQQRAEREPGRQRRRGGVRLAKVAMTDPANIVEAARVAHEVNRAYCEALGDHSQPPWEEAPEWQKESAIAGVRFHIENPNAGPEASHEEWLEHKTWDGWVYGPVKNPEKKEHPCMVPFGELPREQQVKDYLFRAAVRSVLSE